MENILLMAATNIAVALVFGLVSFKARPLTTIPKPDGFNDCF